MNHRHVGPVLLVTLLFGVSAAPVDEKRAPTVEDYRAAIADYLRDGTRSSLVDVAGYNFHWNLDLSPELSVLILSTNYRGELFQFSQEGALQASQSTAEITALHICDLQGDGVFELITEERDVEGTGFFEEKYHLYALKPGRIEHLWSGISQASLLHQTHGSDEHYAEARASLECGRGGLHYRLEERDAEDQWIVTELRLRLARGKLEVESISD